MIDTNVDLFRWPFRRLEGDEPARLVANLRKRGVTQAWAGSYEALLHRDVEGVNRRLAAACKKYGPDFLLPFGAVNPQQPDWQEDVRRCREVHQMAGLRLHPDYHDYKLDAPEMPELLALAAKYKLLVTIALGMEDTRTQFPLMKVPRVDPQPLAKVLKDLPSQRVLLLNGKRGDASTGKLGKAPNVYFDFAMMEGVGGVASLMADTSPARVVFGSHYPLFYFEAAALKVYEAGLQPEQERAVLDDNARALLAV